MRILLVDDEPMLTRSFGRVLARLGHATLVASCGDDAVTLLETERVDLVLCDVRMPRGDGPSVVRRLRARGDATPLLFLTGYADNDDAELKALGAQGVLGKPVDQASLLAAIRALSLG